MLHVSVRIKVLGDSSCQNSRNYNGACVRDTIPVPQSFAEPACDFTDQEGSPQDAGMSACLTSQILLQSPLAQAADASDWVLSEGASTGARAGAPFGDAPMRQICGEDL